MDKLKTYDTKYRDLVDHAADPIISIDHNGLIILFNKSAEKILGYKEEECIGMNITILIPKEYSDRHAAGFKKFINKGKTHIFNKPQEWDGLSKSGDKIPFSVSVWSKMEEDGNYTFTAIMRDARQGKKKREEAERRSLELEKAYAEIEQAYKDLKKTQSQLINSEKMASIGQLAAGVAHEINNPIGFISSNLSCMREYIDDITKLFNKQNEMDAYIDKFAGEDAPETIDNKELNLTRHEKLKILLKEIKGIKDEIDLDYILNDIGNTITESLEGAERVRNIIIALKDFSHVEEEKIKPTDINKSIDGTIIIAWNELKYKAVIKREFGDLPLLPCHPTQIKQVIMNLLINAAHAIPVKGEIKIKTFKENKNIKIEISDTGSGIPEDIRDKIFDPFFTTKEVGKGTGLGLNIVYKIIEKHKGSIDIDSKVGHGTKFIITLPILDE